MYQNISVMGSTGSIGIQTLDVISKLSLHVAALSAMGGNISLLEKQARQFSPKLVAVYDEDAANELKARLADTDIEVVYGEDGVCMAASVDEADLTVMAILGIAGLKPTLCAINAKKDIALATKETLVCAGNIVMQAAKRSNVKLLPVDSEHSAIYQCIEKSSLSDVKRIFLTASGGPFFGKKYDETFNFTPKDALKHPNWSMGQKITVDCATLMNKGFEFIEAMWLYSLRPEQIEIIVHRESIIHSMVEFCDNAVIAQLASPDMRLPIQYALTYPDRFVSPAAPLDLFSLSKLTFNRPDPINFPCLQLALDAANVLGNRGAVLNGANEVAVALFLQEKIKFGEIPKLVSYVMEHVPYGEVSTPDDVFIADRLARSIAYEFQTNQ